MAETMVKEVKFDRITRDWNAFINGQYIGSFNTPGEAEEAINRQLIAWHTRHA